MRTYVALDDQLLAVDGDRSSPAWQVTERLTGHEFECLAATPDAPDRVFAGTVDDGLRRSTDGGATWEQVGGFERRVTAVTVSPHDPTTVWAGTEPSAVYRSRDGGDSWAHCEGVTDLPSTDRWSFPPRPHTHHVRWLAVDPGTPERVYVAIEAGAFVTTPDGGETWQPHPDGARRDNHTLATHPAAPNRVYTAAGDGYAESHDGGASWTYPQTGLDHRYVWGVAVDTDDPDTIVVSAASGARTAHTPARAEAYIYRRQGDRWERAMDGLPDPEGMVRAVLAAGPHAGEFLAVTNRGVFHTADAARSWTPLDIDWPGTDQVPRGLVVE